MVGLAAFAIIAAACAPEDDTPAASDSTGEAPATAEECVQAADIPLTTEGVLTIGTGNPAYAPWYGGKSVEGSEWESSSFTGDPHTGEGYEGAFAYALAGTMGFDDEAVEWVGIPFAKSFAPGPRDFDFAMQQISYSDKRAEAVDFSDGYFDVNQAPNGDRWLTVTTKVEDPQYFRGPYITTSDFNKLPDAKGWNPTPCSAR